ncbi:hypothetical protein BHE74_00005064 [Ensete ventricosum]|nr:hypothetical protein GW17_00026962 [Ensete ventricosum]RWW86171.1 hypothetical protein BHE74_00005064 [Ensete ventricosum]RZR76153.1 hypothetical protein BHM03_00000777 [Ensete ventricosum]
MLAMSRPTLSKKVKIINNISLRSNQITWPAVLFNTSFCTIISTAEIRTRATWTRGPPYWGNLAATARGAFCGTTRMTCEQRNGNSLRRRATRDRSPHHCVAGPASTWIPRGYRSRLAPLLPARHVPAGPPRAVVDGYGA